MSEDTLIVAASVAWLIPFVVSFLKQRAFPASVNMLLAMAAAFGVATLGLVVSGEIDFDNGIQNMDAWLAAAGLAFTESQLVYRLIIKGTATGERINEAITTFPRKPVEAVPLGEDRFTLEGGAPAIVGPNDKESEL